MKHRFYWCDAECERMYPGTPYEYTAFTCSNIKTTYGMTWLPTFCPICGAKLTKDAIARYRGDV